MLVLRLLHVLSRFSGFLLPSPCLWGTLQNLSFSKVSKQVVLSFCVAGVALGDILTCGTWWYLTLHTLHSTLYTPNSTLHTPHSTLYTPHSTDYTPHFTLLTLHFTLYTPHFTLYTLHTTLHTLHFTLYTLHPTLYTHTVGYIDSSVVRRSKRAPPIPEWMAWNESKDKRHKCRSWN